MYRQFFQRSSPSVTRVWGMYLSLSKEPVVFISKYRGFGYRTFNTYFKTWSYSPRVRTRSTTKCQMNYVLQTLFGVIFSVQVETYFVVDHMELLGFERQTGAYLLTISGIAGLITRISEGFWFLKFK